MSDTSGNAPRGSRFLTLLVRGIVLYLLIIAVAFLWALLTKDTLLLFLLLFPLAPLGLAGTAVYLQLKRRMVCKKAGILADVIRNAATSLEDTPPRLPAYDIVLSTKTGFVWQGAVSPFLVASARLLDHARNVVISEDVGRAKQWTQSAFPLGKVAVYTRAVAEGIEEEDPVRTFGALGNLFAFSLLLRRERERHAKHKDLECVPYDDSHFLQQCEAISVLIRQGRFLQADAENERMIDKIRRQEPVRRDYMGWQALIAYWLWIRLSVLELGLSRRREVFKLWASPDKMLATQLELVASCYAKADWVGLSEIIYESFDWRTQIPRFLVR